MKKKKEEGKGHHGSSISHTYNNDDICVSVDITLKT